MYRRRTPALCALAGLSVCVVVAFARSPLRARGLRDPRVESPTAQAPGAPSSELLPTAASEPSAPARAARATVATAAATEPAPTSATPTSATPTAAAPTSAAASATAALAPDSLIPARVRRLSDAEYDHAVHALLGTDATPGENFAPDARQAGFTENESQRIDSVLAEQLAAAAEKLAAEARDHFDAISPCTTPNDLEDCARVFIGELAGRAYRRPLLSEEVLGLLDVYRAGAEDGSYADGLELVVRAVLQSASFLYLTELGKPDPQQPHTVALTDYEIASQLSFLVTGGPPDSQLLAAANAGQLQAPEVRRAELQRLHSQHPESSEQLVRMIRAWLQLDNIEHTAKDVASYPMFELMRKQFIAESHAFIAAVLADTEQQTSDLEALLAADWSVGNKTLADFYGGTVLPNGRITLANRRGILNQGAFLSVQAHARSSAPVLRGAVLARRLACLPVVAPQTLGINVLPPPPDPKLTTRERFELHTTSPACAECHASIDSFGNAFEQFDGMGGLRQTENMSPIDTSTQIAIGADFDGSYPDSNALAQALAKSPSVRECFARHLYRAATARSVDTAGSAARVSEDAFVAEWRKLPEGERGNVLDTLTAYVASPMFTRRKLP